MAQTLMDRHMQAREALFSLFPSAADAFAALKTPQDKVAPFLAIKQLYTQYSMNPSVAFELMAPFRGKKEISLAEWLEALQRDEDVAVPAEDPPNDDLEQSKDSEEQRSPREDLLQDDMLMEGGESAPSQVSPMSSTRSYAREPLSPSPVSHVTKKSLSESIRDIQLTHPKSSALRDKQRWMELARSDFLGLACERGSQKSSVTQIFSDIDYELYPEDIECMGLSEANRNLLAEELKKMAQVNKALRRL